MFETLGQYKILDRIGAGGMGEVYRARDTRLGRTVAIKVLAQDVANDPARRDRFLREARAAAALSHPNIAALYEIGEDQGQLFLAFEFVPGAPLSTVIAGRPLNTRRAVEFAMQIADALADAHAAGIVHRDIKPGNVIITPKDKAKVLDFGLATWTAGGHEREQPMHDATAMATAAGTVLGTAAYMSPEQALGEMVDERTDIFSLGIVLFEMLTGKLPFAGPTPTATALKIVQAPAPSLAAASSTIPKELEPIVAKALAKSLDHRYASAATLAAELRSVAAILDVRSDAAAPVVMMPAAAPRRRAWGKWLAVLLLCAAGGAGAWYERAAIERTFRRTIGPPPPPIIAVVPFDTDPSQTFFADGLAEDLITRLGQTAGLKVVGRSATRNYRGREPRDVARELGAGVVLTGSVRPSKDAVKVSLELIDPDDGTDLWTAQYTRDVKDIFAVQAQVAEEVARALRLKLQPTPSSARAASRVVDPRGYELYLRGRQASAERKLPEAISLFEQAIAVDAGLGEAFAGIAEAVHLQAVFSATDDKSREERIRAAARRAYELDPDLPQANVAMGLSSQPLVDALKYFRRAIELDASYAEAYHLTGDAINDFDPDRALAFYRRSLALDPRQAVIHSDIVSALGLLGRDDEARNELAVIGRSNSGIATGLLALNDLRNGRNAQATAAALAALPSMKSTPPLWTNLVAALRLANRADEALAEATAMTARFPQSCEARVMLAALRFERREVAAARRLADGPLAIANLPSASAGDVRCGLHAAAALQNGAHAAALIDRIAAQEPLLRGFAESVQGQSGTMWIDSRLYPWSLVARQPVVAEARERLDAAYTREREIARAALTGLP
jgi:TolB-like protein